MTAAWAQAQDGEVGSATDLLRDPQAPPCNLSGPP